MVNYTYDEANHLLSETGGKNGSATVTSYTYDGNGSLLTQAATSPSGISTASYSYDAFGRQTRASINGTVALYSYNAQGLRTGKTVGEQNTSFLLDGDNIVAETRGGSLVSRYVYGVNLVSCRSGSSLLYYHQNAHGDVVKITTAAGAVNRSYDYDAFGNEKDPASADANPFRYCGEYWDSETGTYYLRARYYDPSIGRFTQQDTHWNTANMIYGDNPQKINERQDALGLTAYTYVPQISAIMQSGNLYVYAVNNPVLYADGSGEWLHIAAGAALGALIGGVISAGSQYFSGQEIDWASVVIATISGGVSGGLAATGLNLPTQILGNTILGGLSEIAEQARQHKLDFEQYDITDIMISAFVGAAGGVMGGPGGGTPHLDSMATKLFKRVGNAVRYEVGAALQREISNALAYYAKSASKLLFNIATSIIRSFIPTVVKEGGGIANAAITPYVK